MTARERFRLPKLFPVTTAAADDEVTSKERYYNKTGIRISLADSKAKLPGCASGVAQMPVTTACGIRLDGSQDGQGANPGAGASRGYTPRPMTDGYQATRINGERFYTGREAWIKIETIGYNPTTNIYETKDITQDILSFGVTEQAPTITQSGSTVFSLIGLRQYGQPFRSSNYKDFIFGGSKLNSTRHELILPPALGTALITIMFRRQNRHRAIHRRFAWTTEHPASFRAIIRIIGNGRSSPTRAKTVGSFRFRSICSTRAKDFITKARLLIPPRITGEKFLGTA